MRDHPKLLGWVLALAVVLVLLLVANVLFTGVLDFIPERIMGLFG